jgi:hypothetical protein
MGTIRVVETACPSPSPGSRPVRAAAAWLVVGVLAGSCSAPTRSDFQRTASTLGSTFLAAAATLEFTHAGRTTVPYAAGAFVEYRDRIESAADDLQTLDGRPPEPELRRLVDLVSAARAAAADPCLEGPCDWRSQELALQRAGEALVKASSSGG